MVVYMCVWLYVCVYGCMYVCVWLYVCVYICMPFMYVCLYICMVVYVYVYVDVCVLCMCVVCVWGGSFVQLMILLEMFVYNKRHHI